MNTNKEETGLTVGLSKVGNDVKLTLQLATGYSVDLIVNDAKTVYSALHDVKDDIAAKFSELLDVAVDTALEPERMPVRPNLLGAPPGASITFAGSGTGIIDEKNYIQDHTALDAATLLDGKQVASEVAQPDTLPDGVAPKSKKGKTLPPSPSAA